MEDVKHEAGEVCSMSLLVLTQRRAQTYEGAKEKATEYKDAAAAKMEDVKHEASQVRFPPGR